MLRGWMVRDVTAVMLRGHRSHCSCLWGVPLVELIRKWVMPNGTSRETQWVLFSYAAACGKFGGSAEGADAHGRLQGGGVSGKPQVWAAAKADSGCGEAPGGCTEGGSCCKGK